MKFFKTFAGALAFLAVAGLGGLEVNASAVAATPLPDVNNPTIYILGGNADLGNWNLGDAKLFELSYDGSRYEFTVTLAAGDEFKFSVTGGEDWDTFNSDFVQGNVQIAKDNSNFTYSATSDNWKCELAGKYTFYVPEENLTWNDMEWTIFSEGPVDAAEYEVTLMYGDTVLYVDTGLEGATYNAPWQFVEDHTLEGWYLDPAFETPYVPSPLTGDLTLYGKYAELPADADYWVYLETWNDNPLKYVYYWSTYNKTPWGSEEYVMEPVPLAYETESWITVYRIKIKAEYGATNILFHNNRGEQTIDLVLDGSALYTHSGDKDTKGNYLAEKVDAGDAKSQAIDFLNYWSTIRIDNDVYDGKTYDNSICYLLTDTEAWNELNGRYTALSEDSKGLVDPVTDVEGWTVGQTMEYLTNAHSEPAAGPAASVFFSEPENVAGITAGALVLVSVLGFSVFYFVRRRKHASN